MITYAVKVDSVYVFKTIDGLYKKIFVEKLSRGRYYLVHVNLDGSAQDTAKITKADYATKNCVYYSFAADKVIDREPATSDWDLIFTNSCYRVISWDALFGNRSLGQ